MLKSRPGFEARPRPIWACPTRPETRPGFNIIEKNLNFPLLRPFRPNIDHIHRFLALLTTRRAILNLI
jgi:hypothetical protein